MRSRGLPKKGELKGVFSWAFFALFFEFLVFLSHWSHSYWNRGSIYFKVNLILGLKVSVEFRNRSSGSKSFEMDSNIAFLFRNGVFLTDLLIT